MFGIFKSVVQAGVAPRLTFYPFPLKADLGNSWLELPIGFWVSGVAHFCGVFSAGSLFAPAEYDYFEGLKEDQAIEKERHVLDVVEVVF